MNFKSIFLGSFLQKKGYMNLLIILLFCSCAALYSKDDYIQAFADFITEVDEHGSKYSNSDWEKADREYNKFAVVEYERFKSKFNELDSPAVSKLKVIYVVLKFNAKADCKGK